MIIVGILSSTVASFIYAWIQPTAKQQDKVALSIAPLADLPAALVPLPEEIVAEINSRPLLQQDESARHYVGQRFRWRVTLSSAFIKSPGLIALMLKDRGRYPWVYCDVTTESYPWLQTAKTGVELYVIGAIAEVRGSAVYLKDVSLEQASKATHVKP